MIWAILKAQLLSFRGMGMSRNAASLLGFIPVLCFYGIWAFMALGAYGACAGITDRDQLFRVAAIGLLAVFLYWQLAPVLTATMGASLDLQKLIAYPISPDKLFAIEVFLRLFTVGEMLVVLAGGCWGMLRNPVYGGIGAAPRILIGALLFVLANVILGAGVRSLIERTFRRKRFREVAMLVFVLAAALPGAIVGMRLSGRALIPYLPVQRFWPWSAAAGIWLNDVPWRDAAWLAIWVALFYRLSRKQFLKALREDPYAGRSRAPSAPRNMGWAEAFFRLPSRFFGDPLAALLEKDLRALARCAGFRLAFVMGFTFGILVFLPNLISTHKESQVFGKHALTWVSVYSLLLIGYYTFFNAFGYDRSAVQFYFAAPVPFRRVLLAKNLAATVFQCLEVGLITIVFAFIPAPFSLTAVAESFAVSAVVCLYVFAIGNLTSVRFPSPIDPEKLGRGVSSRSKNTFAMLLFPIAFLPVGLAYWGAHVFESQLIFFGLLLLAGGIGAIFYWVATDSALEMITGRREQMIQALSKSEGPLSITG